jgi:N-methylhydantoinase A
MTTEVGGGFHRIGIDVGGTFTDMVLVEPGGSVSIRKVLSTPPDFSRGILGGLDSLLRDREIDARQISQAAHGTTVATNALLTQSGARTALITTRGFRDVLEFGRLRTPRLYDLSWARPTPLIPRELRLEVTERVLASGQVLQPLDRSDVERAIDVLRAEGVQSVAVCLLNSYRNPRHELEIAEMLSAALPELFVSLSSEVLPEIREFERTSTTAVNAYIQPEVKRYLDTLVDGLRTRNVTTSLLVMQSSGGVVFPHAAAARPIHIIESGPAAGVMGAVHVARELGLSDIISFDMGGTTAKACIIEGGQVSHARECEVGAGLNAGHRLLRGGGYLVRSPILDIAEVGAGGGSIARVADGGVLKVGPQSAAAVPGPVCYGRGGSEPTVTDANVVLGYLNPAALAGGSVPIDLEAAQRAIRERIADPLGIDLTEAAFGIHRIANASMVRAVRAVSVERGRDPRRFSLLAFGGGGPVHGAHLGRILEMTTMIVPPAPGVFSSLGLLWSPLEHHYARSFRRRLSEVRYIELVEAFDGLIEMAYAELGKEGISRQSVEVEMAADLHYIGQAAELTIRLPGFRDRDLSWVRELFEAEHETQYGYRSPQEALQFTNLRLVARAIAGSSMQAGARNISSDFRPAAQEGSRSIYFGPTHGWRRTPVMTRGDLSEAFRAGPLAIEEYDSTTIVPPECEAKRDALGNIVVKLGSA